MILKHLTILALLNICASQAAVFLISSKKIEISVLQAFTTETFFKLIKDLNHPEILVFKSVSTLTPDIKNVTLSRGYSSAYIPNAESGNIILEDIADNVINYNATNTGDIKQIIGKTNSTNVLFVIFLPSRRLKREVKELKSSVIYYSLNKSSNLTALLYSSKPLLLKINGPEPLQLYLGNAKPHMINYDTRLNVHVVPIGNEGQKVTLRFSFIWLNGYWSMPSVKVSYTNTVKEFNLTTEEDISAAAYFSYHCNGETIFSDTNGMELHIYDLQVQSDSRNGKFGDANDCVPFMTTPIWSGLLVTAIIGVGLIVALTAIMDIKTMDKFDNQKTKNLPITISE